MTRSPEAKNFYTYLATIKGLTGYNTLWFFIFHALIFSAAPAFAADHAFDKAAEPYDLSQQARYYLSKNNTPWRDISGLISYNSEELRSYAKEGDVHWISFDISNTDTNGIPLYLSIMFTDSIALYREDAPNSATLIAFGGDLQPMQEKKVKTGELVLLPFDLLPYKKNRFWLRLESKTNISRQFRLNAIRSVQVFGEKAFQERFTAPRIYQALFYGALGIMLLYNIFLYSFLRQRSYFYYLLFLSSLILFLSSNSGYLLELLWPSWPRFDLYLRFLNAPLVVCSYLVFSRAYLNTKKYSPRFNRILLMQTLGTIVPVGLMLLGYWKLGRSIVIPGAVASMVAIFIVSGSMLKGSYTPARYFFIANVLLLAGGVVFALQRYNFVVPDVFTHYSLQIGVVAQVALLSIGLAGRISYIQEKLTRQELEAKRLENERILEIQRLTEQKNRELQEKIVAAVAEVQEQKENMERQNAQLAKAQEVIRGQNSQLHSTNKQLEEQVKQRTLELETANRELQQKVKELDAFIYRLSHDIRGPLARLMGLCYVALGEVKDQEAVEYFEKLNLTASELNVILKRLITIYEISQAGLKYEKVSLSAIIHRIRKEADSRAEMANQFTYEHKGDDSLNVDTKMLHFMLKCLLENAIQYSQDAQPAPMVEVKLRKGPHEHIIIIRDNGPGIPGEEEPFLFELFSKAATGKGNLGIGLYIAHITARKMGGSIAYRRNITENLTEFIVTIPEKDEEILYQRVAPDMLKA